MVDEYFVASMAAAEIVVETVADVSAVESIGAVGAEADDTVLVTVELRIVDWLAAARCS